MRKARDPNATSPNDFHVRADGTVGPGLATTGDLLGVVNELEYTAAAEQLMHAIAERLQTLKDKDLPMLKGQGFIVVDPTNPRFDGEEHADFEAAKDSGSNIAYKSGKAIIYAPVLVMKPKRETADSQPSDLLKQLALPTGAPVASIAAPTE